jgi:peptidoglycan/xylan/chitin deacetylase (PgdA/CDA1 family)
VLRAEEVKCELAESKRAIEERLGSPCLHFAYPNGSWSAPVREQVVQQGYSQAFVNSPGVWTAETDPWLIPRVNLWEGSLLGITGKFSPVVFQYTAFWRSYRATRRVR